MRISRGGGRLKVRRSSNSAYLKPSISHGHANSAVARKESDHETATRYTASRPFGDFCGAWVAGLGHNCPESVSGPGYAQVSNILRNRLVPSSRDTEDERLACGVSSRRRDSWSTSVRLPRISRRRNWLSTRLVVLNNANALTDLLDEKQRQAVEKWYKKGNGLVALHAALVHQTKWKWYTDLAGCDFNSDSDFLKAKVVIDPTNKEHPSVQGFGPEFNYSADWTNHNRAVTDLPGVKVLFRVDEATYEPVRDFFKTRGGKPMGKDHPAAWLRESDGGRFFYTEARPQPSLP